MHKEKKTGLEKLNVLQKFMYNEVLNFYLII